MKRIFLILMGILWVTWLSAADLVAVSLTNGVQISGELLMENDQMIVIRDPQGRRFQYPKSDIRTIDRQVSTLTQPTATSAQVEESKKVAIRIIASVGAATLPKQAWGTDVNAHFQIGTYNLGHRHIFLGGSIGYHGLLFAQTYSYIPIQAVVSVPLLPSRHAPAIGFSMGYGISAHHTSGGLCAGIDVDYRYAFAATSALLVGLYTHFQQDNLLTYSTIDGQSYALDSGHSLVSLGAHLAIVF